MKYILSLFLLLFSFVGYSSAQNKSSFIHVEKGRFILNGSPYYYIGTNFWYGAILGSEGEGGNRARLNKELDYLKSIGINNLRVLVGADGENGIRSKVEPTLQKSPGVYNDTILAGLDYLLYQMGKRKMYAVLYLNNSWEWTGGYSQYLQWAGYGKAPVPAIDGWPAYMAFVKQFPKSDSAKKLFHNYVKDIIGRTNRYTKKKYVNDPYIMSWQIGNEPRAFADENKEPFALWIADVAAQIKSLDKNHMVSTGSEGKHGCEQDINLFERIHADKNVDYMNIHLWPYNWSWVTKDSLSEKLQSAKEKTKKYIFEHLAVAKKHQKPLVMEEFGFPRDGFKFSKESTTNSRDSFYKYVFELIIADKKAGGPFAGCNFWGWGGFANPSKEHIYWQKGDDYCGDPAQEEQGLNSVFASDKSTVKIIKESVLKFK
jgi:Endo-beta-mannanase